MAYKITIVGLGAGDIDQLPLGVYKRLKKESFVFLRTKEHPVVRQLEEEGVSFISFDSVYEQHDQFEQVYEEIVERLLNKAKEEDILYAVPGHPLVAEKTVQLLLERGKDADVDVVIGGGQSFLDSLFAALKIDPVEGFQFLDGTDLHRDDIHVRGHIIIGQVYDSFVASDVKLTLMEKYPDDYPIYIVQAAGSSEEKIAKVPLYQLDHEISSVNNLTSIYVPQVKDDFVYREFSSLREIIRILRGPNGCPWDKKQTHQSLKKYLIEECYELLSAIDHDDIDNMIEELGDVLLQVMLHSQIGEDEGLFSIEDVLESISRKMVHRHPHVFGDETAKTAEEVVKNWEAFKQREKGRNAKGVGILDEIEKGLPAVIRAYEIQKKAAKTGFDWEKADEAAQKVEEEWREFLDEVKSGDKKKQVDELGDVLFALINTARFFSIHPEEALAQANDKFIRRFSYVEQKVKESGQSFQDFSLTELDRFWNEAKEKGL
ncbi:nucleoside triphosphate pyrophosphohydrolase [Bacillus sp. FSL W8-0102]|uniref:nucleoside triphosphate pyrophosphohydrolase n=1 Tax=Bacillus sp. FSL W8-0102 TaxID=2978205 RepID=UPI0030FACCA8